MIPFCITILALRSLIHHPNKWFSVQLQWHPLKAIILFSHIICGWLLKCSYSLYAPTLDLALYVLLFIFVRDATSFLSHYIVTSTLLVYHVSLQHLTHTPLLFIYPVFMNVVSTSCLVLLFKWLISAWLSDWLVTLRLITNDFTTILVVWDWWPTTYVPCSLSLLPWFISSVSVWGLLLHCDLVNLS